MRVGKFHSVGCELIDVGRGDFGFGIVASGISVAHVIGENDDDVGFFSRESGAETKKTESEMLDEGHCGEPRGINERKQRREREFKQKGLKFLRVGGT